MIMMTEDRTEKSDDRLRQKTQDQTLIQAVIAGANMCPWAARELPQLVSEIYLNSSGERTWKPGILRHECVAICEGAGKPLKDCQLVSVYVTYISTADDIAVERSCGGYRAVRRARICRMTEEAREQGGLLTQEDLGHILGCDVRTLRRDTAYILKTSGIHVATRGYLKDIGPSVSHKGVAICQWLGGKEPVDVARHINHSLAAVERYISSFLRVALLAAHGDFDAVAIACTTKLSDAVIQQYLTIYAEAKNVEAYRF